MRTKDHSIPTQYDFLVICATIKQESKRLCTQECRVGEKKDVYNNYLETAY